MDYNAQVLVRPDVDASSTVDASTVAVIYDVEIFYKEESGADDKIPVTFASVQIGVGEDEEGEDEDFEWTELTHQEEGQYLAEVQGYHTAYRVIIESQATGRRVHTVESPAIHVITGSLDGES